MPKKSTGIGSVELKSAVIFGYTSADAIAMDRKGFAPMHLLRCIAKNMEWEIPPPGKIHRADLSQTASTGYQDTSVRKPYAEQVRERYRVEEQFMEDIRQGRHIAAIADWRSLHRSVAFMKLGQTMEAARLAAAINRTTIRLAAWQAGMPATINDQLSGDSAARIRNAKNTEEIDREHERVIREYCRVLRAQKQAGYSNLVLSALYQMEHHYTDKVTVEGMAAELEVTPNYLISEFKAAVGVTPNVYLRQVRMKQAARLLAGSRTSVQEISAQVGILDANYFAKVFKSTYGETPVEYRKNHKM